MASHGQAEIDRKAEAVDWICTQLADGVPQSKFRPKLSEYGVCDRTVRRWVREAEARIGREAGQFRDSYLGRNLARYDYIYRRAVEGVPTKLGRGPDAPVENVPDLMLAKNVCDSIAKMLGLNEAVTIEHRIPAPWHSAFDELGIRRPGNGTGDGADGGEDESPQVRH